MINRCLHIYSYVYTRNYEKFQTLLILLLALGLFTLNACKDDEDDVTPQEEAKTTYTDDASAVFNASCAFSGCHNSGSQMGSLANYADAKAFAGWGKMIPAVKHEAGVTPMPYNQPKLSDADISTLEKWVEDGLLE